MDIKYIKLCFTIMSIYDLYISNKKILLITTDLEPDG